MSRGFRSPWRVACFLSLAALSGAAVSEEGISSTAARAPAVLGPATPVGPGHGDPNAAPALEATETVSDPWVSLRPAATASKIHRPLFIESIPAGRYRGFLNPGSVLRTVDSATCWGIAVEVVQDVDGGVTDPGPYCTVRFYLNLALSPVERRPLVAPRAAGAKENEVQASDRVLESAVTVYSTEGGKAWRLLKGSVLRARFDRSCWGVAVDVVEAKSGSDAPGPATAAYCVSEKALVGASAAQRDEYPGERDASEVRDLSEIRVERHASSFEPLSSYLEKKPATELVPAVVVSSAPTSSPSSLPAPTPAPRSSPTPVAASTPRPTPAPTPVTPDTVARHAVLREEAPPAESAETRAPSRPRGKFADWFGRSWETPTGVKLPFPPGLLRGLPETLAPSDMNADARRKVSGPEADLYLPSDRCKAGLLRFGDQFCMVLAVGPGVSPVDAVVRGRNRYGAECGYALETTFNGPLPVGPPPRYKLVKNGKREDTDRWGNRPVVELYGIDKDGRGVRPPTGRGEFRVHAGRDETTSDNRESIEWRPTTGCLRLSPQCQDRFLEWVSAKKDKAVLNVEEVDDTRDELTNERRLFGKVLAESITKEMRLR